MISHLRPIAASAILVCLSLILATVSSAQTTGTESEAVPFTAENWNFIGGTEITKHLGVDALRLAVRKEGAPFGFGAAILKDRAFGNGVIEYDVAFGETRTFAGLNFRLQGPGNGENFYMRAHQSGNPDANQYMTNYNGIPSWQLYYGTQYSSPTEYSFDEWMRVKLVVVDGMADIYIKDMEKPAYTVDLKREERTGGVGLWALNLGGPAWFANFSIKESNDVKIVGTPVAEKPATPGTVMTWQVSQPVDGAQFANKPQLSASDTDGLKFSALKASSSGLSNLARLSGVKPGANAVYAKFSVSSQTAQNKKFEFGFSDTATVYLNGKAIFSGADYRASRDYRFLGTVGYWDAVYLPLNEGDNEVVIVVSELVQDTTGWAVQGRFVDMDGLAIK